ncbi:NAD(P)/FAD-dependent oxidoreductase [Nocardioides sp. NPDC087217]|uniref:NAD(P)/FAD-dependent oxidoreductase n=1 Tax=Nocardioides sp. NPDC087217 TaxID=3364335 RepID=UPI0038040BFD
MKVIVIGAGILGASVTYQLAKRGCDVTVIEKGIPGGAASAASFAWLNSNNKQPQHYHNLNAASINEWAIIARELRSSAWLRREGNVHVASGEAETKTLEERVDRLHSWGYAAVKMAPSELPRLDPMIRVRDGYSLAAFFPGEGFITVPLLIHDLLNAAKSMGALLLEGTGVAELIGDGGRVTGVALEDGRRIAGDLVVVAAGAGIGPLMATQGVSVNTEGKLGVTVTTSPGASGLTTMLHLPGISIRPDTGGRLVVRSPESDTHIDPDNWTLPDAEVRRLLEVAASGVTDIDPERVRGERICIAVRPYPIDGLPVVGAWDGIDGLYVMTMHSGVTQGAIVGRLAAEEITTENPSDLLAPFRPKRVIDTNKDSSFDPHAIEGESAPVSS